MTWAPNDESPNPTTIKDTHSNNKNKGNSLGKITDPAETGLRTASIVRKNYFAI